MWKQALSPGSPATPKYVFKGNLESGREEGRECNAVLFQLLIVPRLVN